jgi:hypothetical protein
VIKVTYLSKLDLVSVVVDWAWGAFSDIFLICKFTDENFGLIFSLTDTETVIWRGLFY